MTFTENKMYIMGITRVILPLNRYYFLLWYWNWIKFKWISNKHVSENYNFLLQFKGEITLNLFIKCILLSVNVIKVNRIDECLTLKLYSKIGKTMSITQSTKKYSKIHKLAYCISELIISAVKSRVVYIHLSFQSQSGVFILHILGFNVICLWYDRNNIETSGIEVNQTGLQRK
jgi:hypothetical protein